MRVMIDTNLLFSALLFPNGQAAKVFKKCVSEHELVISSYVIDELKRVVRKKFPTKLNAIDVFLEKLSFDLVYTPENIEPNLFKIRDHNDYPILYTAIIENVDVLVTGDADFFDTDVTHPEILTPTVFYEKY